jgi:hypothetical protein
MKFSLLAGFLLRAIFWLLLCLLVWYAAGAFIAMPVGWLAGVLAHLLFPSWAEGAELSGTHADLLTSLQLAAQPGAAAGQVALLTPEADYLTYGYGLPLLMALFLASHPHGMAGKMLLAAVALLPLQAISLLFAWLKEVAITAGPSVADQIGFGELAREVIALGYQFGTLVLPTLAPVVLWLALDRKLLSTLLVEAFLERAEPDQSKQLTDRH